MGMYKLHLVYISHLHGNDYYYYKHILIKGNSHSLQHFPDK